MKLIKLNAIDSTNEFIKKNKLLFSENLFCVYTFNQTLGKGQRGNIWNSQPFKNLCISFYFKPNDNNVKKLFFKLNMLVSIKILHFLKSSNEESKLILKLFLSSSELIIPIPPPTSKIILLLILCN